MVVPESRHHLFDRAIRRAEWNVEQLWLGSIASGGTTSVLDLEAFLYGLTPLPPAQQDVLASTLNERLDDLYQSARVAYLIAPGLPDPPAEDPLAVLAEHLNAAKSARQPRSAV
ncbi:MAG: hypothetical protein ACRYG2_13290 [Janthinobacterium lividum]